MLELLRFEYYRLLKSKFLWVLAALSFILPMLTAILINFLIKQIGVDFDEIDMDRTNIRLFTWYIVSYFYERLPLALAVFIPLFIGRDYKDGFIRNKLTAGHSRIEIFGSAVITEASVTVLLSLCYILGSLLGCLFTRFGCDLNNGEMLLRAFTLLLSLLSLSVLFTAISMVIKSRAGTMVICVAFVFSFGIFSMMAGNYSYNHQMIDEYEELYNEALENAPEGYYDLSDKEFDKNRYFNTGWFIGHPLFVATNATLGSEFEPTLSSMIMNESMITGENMFEYPKTITRLPFVNSYYSMFTGNYGAFMVDRDDLNDITGAVVSFERAELEYNIKSIVWSAIYFGAGYLIFRKKNVF